MDNARALILDVDGTFLKTDLLFESLWAGLGQAPLATLGACLRHGTDPAALKLALRGIVELRLDLMPVNATVLERAKAEQAAGRQVLFASASEATLVSELADLHGMDQGSLGTTAEQNLKGSAKADALVERYGAHGFDYAGDSRADLVVWERADNAIVVGDTKLAGLVSRPTEQVEGGWKMADLIRAFRPHQWVKNVLLFLPMLAAHDFSLSTFFAVLLGIIAFSAAASTIYIVNDLLDLEADRLHAKKHKRPFASGAVPIQVGMAACGGLGLLAIVIAALLNPAFLAVILVYMVLSLTYSLRWKRLKWIDIATLAALYTIRVVGGAAAGAVYVSAFMLIFIFPIFIALGCVKRMTELTLAKDDAPLPGRAYARSDRGALLRLAWVGVAGTLVTFFCYSLTEQARTLYPLRGLLLLAMVPMTLWLVRMVRLGYFGKQDYDPIVFALQDKRGIGLLLIIVSILFYAAGLWQSWLGL